MSQIAEWIGISRQAIYKSRKRFDQRGDLREKITEFVQAQRLINKKIGGVKLQRCFVRDHPEDPIGRDRFLDVLRDAGLLLRRKRAPKSASASSAERTGRQDLAHKLSVAGPGHLWVQDDTEVVILQGKAYLALSTDAYSHKVVGYSWSQRANSEHVQAALKMALAGHVHGEMTLIHHSDNGSIYGSKAYQLLLENEPIVLSWSPPGRPDRNAIAERINLTFKQEYLCDSHAKSFQQIKLDLPVYIRHYNESRPHMSCGNSYPSKVHEGIAQPKKLWKQRPASYPRSSPEGYPLRSR
ncbi:IS3 family transposase [Rhodohalobacter sulfatireducens]|uniref:IS3 family transposase n=1 Tax=Rhodohalobacter sulfatireducens TaxID=2911366 RepID=A0ABS9KJV7_9BACT|nr:IS3 family transposase [Rhodohalobacter sulfatireducens]MCG2591118.1 IS3 family transposase [Rhodohalobacter sulfatireducens]